MKVKILVPTILLLMSATFLATLVLAQVAPLTPLAQEDAPKYDKYVASLEFEEVRYGQVIFNTNPEDDETFELEVEVEECIELNNSKVDVYLNDGHIGEIYIDEYGNGKATFYVDDISIENAITVDGDVTLESSEWRLWVKGKGKK